MNAETIKKLADEYADTTPGSIEEHLKRLDLHSAIDKLAAERDEYKWMYEGLCK